MSPFTKVEMSPFVALCDAGAVASFETPFPDWLINSADTFLASTDLQIFIKKACSPIGLITGHQS